MTWKEYLVSKKIDPDRFKSGNNRLFREMGLLFEQLHPDSFTAQKLYLINRIRRNYKLELTGKSEPQAQEKKPRPKLTPKIKK